MTRSFRHRSITSSLALLALGLSASAACNSDFQDCSASRNCAGDSGGAAGSGPGSGGTNSAAGAGNGTAGDSSSTAGAANAQGGDTFVIGSGGDSGLPPLPTECQVADECDDGHVCTGSELCVDGACQYGELPCTNPDPDHCVITCIEDVATPVCGSQGIDADGDGYLTDACADNPGEDCNDSATEGANIHPGVEELCNGGIDDDCDGADETADEVGLNGSSQILAAPVGTTVRDQVAITSNPTGSGFGVVWSDWRNAGSPTTSELYYVGLGADGTATQPVRATNSTEYNENGYPDIEWGPTTYVTIAYRATEVSSGDQLVRSVKVAQDASSFNAPTTLGIATLTAGPKVGGGTFVQIGNDIFKCTTSCTKIINLAGETPSFAVGMGKVVYANGSAGNWAISQYDDALAQTTSVDTSYVEPGVALSQSGARFAFRHQTDAAAPLELIAASCAVADGLPVAVAGVGTSTAVLYWNSDETALYVRIVKSGCAAGPWALVVQEDGTVIGNADLAADKNGNIAVVWSSKDTSNNQWSIMGRVFGVKLCE